LLRLSPTRGQLDMNTPFTYCFNSLHNSYHDLDQLALANVLIVQDYGIHTPADIVLNLLVDDGEPSRQNRKNLLKSGGLLLCGVIQ
jgi:hypothetical protein